MTDIRRRLHGERGAVAVEFALLLPVLLLLLVGTIQFGIIYSQFQVMQGAAREGARCAAVENTGFAKCDPQGAVDAALAGYKRSSNVSQNIECTDSTRSQNVTISWDQKFETGPLAGLIPGFPSTITRTISGTFRCE